MLLFVCRVSNICLLRCETHSLLIDLIFLQKSKVRKVWLHMVCRANFLTGLGGPGAPHQFSFFRHGDLLEEGN